MKEIKLTPKQKEVLLNTQPPIKYYSEELEKAKAIQSNIISLILDSNKIEYKGQDIEFKEDTLIIK